jgi:hypothetical protein
LIGPKYTKKNKQRVFTRKTSIFATGLGNMSRIETVLWGFLVDSDCPRMDQIRAQVRQLAGFSGDQSRVNLDCLQSPFYCLRLGPRDSLISGFV